MFELVKEVPVTFGPHWADEWQVWLTGGSIIASSILGLLAYANGKKATEIAKGAEAARAKDLENARTERAEAAAAQRSFEQQLRFDDALSALFLAVNEYVYALEKWIEDRPESVLLERNESSELWQSPLGPSPRTVLAALETMHLRSREDKPSYLHLASGIRLLLFEQPERVIHYLPLLVQATRMLRIEQLSHEAFTKQVDSLLSEAGVERGASQRGPASQ
ncbi:MAG: hypothetical protein ACTH30_14670 [Leucobacter sp.]